MSKNKTKRAGKVERFTTQTRRQMIIQLPEEDFERDEYTEDYQLKNGIVQDEIITTRVTIKDGVCHLRSKTCLGRQREINSNYEVVKKPKVSDHLIEIAKGVEL